jgi:hypothetical protein
VAQLRQHLLLKLQHKKRPKLESLNEGSKNANSPVPIAVYTSLNKDYRQAIIPLRELTPHDEVNEPEVAKCEKNKEGQTTASESCHLTQDGCPESKSEDGIAKPVLLRVPMYVRVNAWMLRESGKLTPEEQEFLDTCEERPVINT